MKKLSLQFIFNVNLSWFEAIASLRVVENDALSRYFKFQYSIGLEFEVVRILRYRNSCYNLELIVFKENYDGSTLYKDNPLIKY